MSNNSSVDWHEYFNSNSRDWLVEAYKDSDYTYPVGYHRLRVLKRILDNYDIKDKQILDIGCGGGDISFYLASQGAFVDGIDMSESMLQIANNRKKNLPQKEKERVRFQLANFAYLNNDIKERKYDFIIAFGLIGYLESDDQFFNIVDSISKINTVLILSCRNRLFNITSVTSNTVNEIESGNAVKLIEEIDSYYGDKISEEKSKEFVSKIYENSGKLQEHMKDITDNKTQNMVDELPGTGMQQPRQSTPKDLSRIALQYGYINEKLYGIHPHLLLPRMNRILPPQFFNVLSDALCVFEDERISLIYSSVFVGVFEKTNSF